MPHLSVGFVHFPVRTLGPGVRSGLFVTGCGRGCPGCIARREAAPDPSRRVPVEALVSTLADHLARGAEGLTVSGGEPFEQPEGLAALLAHARGAGFRDILVYTGYLLEELAARRDPALAFVDALVDGPFLRDRPSDDAWRGSANQRLHLLGADPALRLRYERFVAARPARRPLQMVERDGALHLIGIPDARDTERILDGLAQDLPDLRL